ncbi:hypothetical protein SLEP1_g30401 [Rubroshorea leprosula]|uniref:Integrase catalytic domain-containing protein n=1 Tax=Rubroshorea leprosula TaxID=152421 RepID=A0AAV5KA94_9ROSI|nr:hypothetical protein SLEP1_g30401 [Rubroshorea leprosula]
MPPKKNLGKAVQTLQIGLGEGSPTHSEGENEPIIPPPLSPILREHSFVNPTFNKGSESGDDVAQSSDSLVKAMSDQISIMRHTLMESEEKARQRSQEAFRRVRIEPQPQAADLQRQNQNIPAPALGGQVNLPQPPPQIQQAAGEPVQPDPVEAAPRVADLGNHQHPRYLPPPRRPNGGHQQHNAPPPREHFQPYVPPVQQNLPNLPGQYINRDQIIDMVQEAYGPVLRPLVRPAYRKPYPDFIDQENPFPRGFKVPEFTLFSGDGGYSTIEHIGRFTIQCGEASGDENLKLRLFPSSLTSTALTWYLSLPQNSVYTWRQMEDLFHIQFYRSEPEVSMADLSRLVQRPRETSEAFLARFRKARLKCRIALPEQEFGILRFPDKAKETMGVDADPFPTMSVGVNAAYLKSIARDRTQTYYRRRLAADDLRWVIEEARTRRNQVRSGSYRRRQSGGHNSTQQKNNANLAEKPRMVKPPPRSPTKRWERVVHPKFPKGQNPRTLRRRLQRKRAAERHQQQITYSGGMANQAQPLPARRKSVWVRKEKGSSSGQNAPKKEEPPRIPTSPRVLAVESNEETGLKAKFDMPDKAENSSDVICFGEFSVNLSCLVITLPLVFQAKEQSESAVCHQADLTEEEEGVMSRIVVVEKRILPSIHMRGMAISACSIDITQTDWRYPIMEYLKNPNFKASRRTKMQALNYVLLEGVLYRRGHDELLLRCLGPDEYCQIMSDVHNGICGAHQDGIKMRWLIRRHGFFWPSILKDCISYAKGCKACQIHGPLQRVPASELHPIVKPWPFRGWAIDLIGKVYPPSTRGHSFIIVATDYFTKWVEAKPMKKVDQTDIIKFLKEEIIHRFGLPETVTSDQGTVFVGAQVEAFAKEMGFRLLTSTPHYAQANGQAEASNRIVINLLEKMVDDNPRYWHELLSDTIWAYRTSQRSSTKVTPFSLTYGHDAVLPMELSARSLRIAIQHGLTSGEYNEAMILELEDLEGMRLTALDRLQTQKLKVARAYNKRVKSRSLAEGDLVWKVILPPGKKDPRFGKWSPNWEGPFRIHEVLRGGAYWLESLNGELHPRKINGIYLKPYYPMIWEARDLDTIDST